jgi:hypothetical protein
MPSVAFLDHRFVAASVVLLLPTVAHNASNLSS